MYDPDWLDEMWMDYKATHPTTWRDVKDFCKALVFVTVVTVGVIGVPMLCMYPVDAVIKKVKANKEQKLKQQKEIEYKDALQMKNQIIQDKSKTR